VCVGGGGGGEGMLQAHTHEVLEKVRMQGFVRVCICMNVFMCVFVCISVCVSL